MIAESAPEAADTGWREVELSISIRTILLVGVAVAVAWALASVANVLLLILVSVFSVAVLLPVVNAMERSGWSRGLASAALVLGIVLVAAVVVLVLAQPVGGAVHAFGDHLPAIVGKASESDVGTSSTGAATRWTR